MKACKVDRTLFAAAVLLCFVLIPLRPADGAILSDFVRLASLAADMPTGLAVDSQENLYVVQAARSRLAKYDRAGNRLRLLSEIDQPLSIAVAPNGRVLVGSFGNGSVTVYAPNLQALFQLGKGPGEFERPLAIVASSAGIFYVADAIGKRISAYDSGGRRLFSFGTTGSNNGQFTYPTAMAISESAGELYVADLRVISGATGARIQVFDLNGNFRRSFGSFKVGDGGLIKPLGMDFDGQGRLLVVDGYQNVILVFDSTGAYQGAIYDPAAPLRTGLDITVGSKTGRIFVADETGIQIYAAAGQAHTITATAGTGGAINPAGVISVYDSLDQHFRIFADEGFHVSSVLVDGVAVGPVAAYTFSAVTQDHTISATFAPDTHTITASVEGSGTVTPAGTISVDHGSSLSFTLAPAAGHQVSALEVDGTDAGAVIAYTLTNITSDHAIRAVFSELPPVSYPLSVSTSGQGTVSSHPDSIDCPEQCSADFAAGTVITLVASPAAGQSFAGWSGSCSSSSLSCAVSMNGPKTVNASFLPSASDAEGFEAGGLSDLPWMTGRSNGQSGWFAQDEVSYTGQWAVRTPDDLQAGDLGYLEVTLTTTTAGPVFFRLKTASADTIAFKVDGIESGSWSGDEEWTAVQYEVAPG